MESYEKYLQSLDISENTIKHYKADIKQFISWVKAQNNEFKESYVTELMTAGYKKHLVNKGYATRSINRKIASLLNYANFLVNKGYLTKNPAAGLKMIQLQQLSPRSLKHVELIRFFNMAYAKGIKRDIAIISILYNVGLRIGEITRLKIKDISIRERTGEIQIEASKRYKSRKVTLNKDVRDAIHEYINERLGKLHPGEKLNGEDRFLVGERGDLKSSGVYRIVLKYAKMAGIEGMTPHTLRHTFIRNLLDSKDPVTVAEIAGLSTIKLLEIYGKPRLEHIEQAVESIALTNLISKEG